MENKTYQKILKITLHSNNINTVVNIIIFILRLINIITVNDNCYKSKLFYNISWLNNSLVIKIWELYSSVLVLKFYLHLNSTRITLN